MNANIARTDTSVKQGSKLRIAAAGVLGAAGLSVIASLVPAVANAAPVPAPISSSVQQGADGPTVKLDHHQRKEVGKQARKDAKGKQQVTPASTRHLH